MSVVCFVFVFSPESLASIDKYVLELIMSNFPVNAFPELHIEGSMLFHAQLSGVLIGLSSWDLVFLSELVKHIPLDV